VHLFTQGDTKEEHLVAIVYQQIPNGEVAIDDIEFTA
jgi:hypothetical protein